MARIFIVSALTPAMLSRGCTSKPIDFYEVTYMIQERHDDFSLDLCESDFIWYIGWKLLNGEKTPPDSRIPTSETPVLNKGDILIRMDFRFPKEFSGEMLTLES